MFFVGIRGMIIPLVSRGKLTLHFNFGAGWRFDACIVLFFVILKRMKAVRIEKLLAAVLLVIFGGVVVHAPLSVWLGTAVPDYSLLIKAWKEVLLLFATVLAAVVVTKRQLWRWLAGDWVMRLVAAYGALHVALAAFLHEGFAATAAGLLIDLRYVLFFGLAYVLMKVAPQWRRWMVRVGTAGAFVVVCFATMQLFLPPDILAHIGYSRDTIAPYLTVDKNPAFIRVNSTLRGPNPLGAYAGMALGFVAAALARGRLQRRGRVALITTAVLTSCSLVALWISYSRSALVAGIVIVLVVAAATVLRSVSRRVWISMAVAAFALAGGLVASLGTPFVSNVLLHENQEGGSEISSNEGHIESLVAGVQAMARQPLGGGVGSTGSASLLGDKLVVIENQYLFIAHEAGWLGLLLFIALYALIMKKLWQRRGDWLALGAFAGGIGLAAIGLLLPVWADDTVSIVWWGLAAVAIGGKYGRKQTK